MRRARREQPKFSHSRAVERARLTPGRLRKSAICRGGQSDPLHPRGRRILRTPSGANWYHSLLLAIANRGLGGHAAHLRRRRAASVRGHGRGHAAPCRGAAGASPPRRSRPSQPTAPPAAQRAGAPPVNLRTSRAVRRPCVASIVRRLCRRSRRVHVEHRSTRALRPHEVAGRLERANRRAAEARARRRRALPRPVWRPGRRPEPSQVRRNRRSCAASL